MAKMFFSYSDLRAVSLKAILLTFFFATYIDGHAERRETGSGDSITYLAETRATFSGGDNTPFWLVNNLQGLGSIKKNNGFVRGAVFKDIDKGKRFSWGAGLDLVAGWNLTAPFSIHQAYAEVKYRSLNALIGSKEIWGDFNDPKLSSGNILYSGNSMPIPQLRLGIFDYADFWGTKGWFAVKGYIAYGMFTDSNWQKTWAAPDSKHTADVLYHSKGLWLRGGKTSVFPLQGVIGIEMATQFGGKSYKDGQVVKMPHGIKDWLKAFFPQYGKRDTFNGQQSTIEGNMLGAYNIALSWLPNADWNVKAYYEHYFDDQSQMTFEYGWKDGLYGIEAQLPTNRIVSSIVYEYLYTKDQTGAVNHDSTSSIPEQISGRDNYYNHSVYQGWQHWGMGIGNPLVLSPIYNSDRSLSFRTTRVEAHHIGFSGNPTPEINYRVLLSYSRNWGSYAYPLPEIEDNFNSLVEISWKPLNLKGWYLKGALAFDNGDLIGKSFGGMVTIGKTGNFSLSKRKQK
jgi:hypothetical protein